MMTAAHAAKLAQQLGKQLQAVIDVGEFLEKLGSLEQAIAEAERARMIASEQSAEVQKGLVVAQEMLTAAQASVQEAQAEARRVFSESKRISEQLSANARKTAQDTLAKATTEANARTDRATASVQNLEKKRTVVTSEIAELRGEYNTLKRALAELRERTRVED